MDRRDLEKKRFLVVDDFGEMRSMLRGLLALLNITNVDMAANGKDAIVALEIHKYDVILCDYNLGSGKDGQQVLEEARHRRLIGLNTLFLMITAENTRDMVMGVIEYAPDSYLSKPFTKDVLLKRITKLFEKRADFSKIDLALVKENYPLALTLIDEQIKERRKHIPELNRLKADSLYHAAKYNEAEMLYEEILSERDLPWANLGLSKVYFAQKRHEVAKELLEKLIEKTPTLTSAYDLLADCHTELNNKVDAQIVLQDAVKISPKNIIRQQVLGDLCIKNNDFDRAEKAFTQAVDYGRFSVYNHPSVYTELAKTKTTLNKHKEALKVLERVGRVFRDDDEAQLYAGSTEAIVRQNLGQDEKAKACIEKVELLYEKSDGVMSPASVLELAKSNAYLGNSERAEALLNRVVRNNYHDEALLADISAIYKETNLNENPDDLIKSIRKEIIQMNNKGVKFLKDGDYDQAITLFEEAAENMKENKSINLNAARAWIMKIESSEGVDVAGLAKIRSYIDRVTLVAPKDAGLKQVRQRWNKLAK